MVQFGIHQKLTKNVFIVLLGFFFIDFNKQFIIVVVIKQQH